MSRLVSLVILIALVIVLAILLFQVMSGFLLPLFLAALMAVLFRPMHRRIIRMCRGHDRVAAALTTAAIMLIVLVPISAALFRAASQAWEFALRPGSHGFDEQTLKNIVDRVNDQFGLSISAAEVRSTIADKANSWFGPLASKTPGVLGSLLVGGLVLVFALYYFLADGQQLITAGMKMVPLDQKYQQQLVSKFEEVSRAVTSATLLSALGQGIAAGIGFYFAGLHGIILLMFLTMLGSFIPFVGSACVWGGCAMWLYFSDHSSAAIFLAIWGVCIISMVDNIVKPLVLHGQSKLHPLLALLSVLGGLQVLGPIGIFIGPMAVAFLQAGLNMLNRELEALPGSRTDPVDAAI